MSAGVVDLRFPADSRYLVLARLSLAGLAPLARLDPDALLDLKLAVTEACSNAIRHAYPADEPGEVRVRIELSPDRVLVEVSDNGSGFDSSGVQSWSASAMREEGMGLSIIETVTDELEIASSAESGTTVRFAKLLG
jgi:serine/threonine-protein kinase RsbW